MCVRARLRACVCMHVRECMCLVAVLLEKVVGEQSWPARYMAPVLSVITKALTHMFIRTSRSGLGIE